MTDVYVLIYDNQHHAEAARNNRDAAGFSTCLSPAATYVEVNRMTGPQSTVSENKHFETVPADGEQGLYVLMYW